MIPEWIREHNVRCVGGLAGVPGALKKIYSQFRRNAFPKLTPLLSQVRKSNAPAKWGGQGVFFDVVLSKHAPQGHLYVLPNQATIVVPNMSIKQAFVSLPVIHNPQRGMITGITL